jgi:hypothetical protein
MTRIEKNTMLIRCYNMILLEDELNTLTENQHLIPNKKGLKKRMDKIDKKYTKTFKKSLTYFI